MRQRGEEVFFLTGTDEHGEPVAQAAEREGVTPRELADRNAERFKALMPRLNVSNDFFIRTSDPEHGAKVQEILQRVHDNGHVYAGTYEGWYCPRCADFKTESEIGEGNTCPIHGIPLEREKEDNWFFRLSTFQEPLERLYAERPDFVLPRAASTKRRRSSTAGCRTSRSRAPGSPGACRCPGTTARSSTSGSTRCSTTSPRCATRAPARTSPSASGPPTSTSSARTSSSSTPSSGPRC